MKSHNSKDLEDKIFEDFKGEVPAMYDIELTPQPKSRTTLTLNVSLLNKIQGGNWVKKYLTEIPLKASEIREESLVYVHNNREYSIPLRFVEDKLQEILPKAKHLNHGSDINTEELKNLLYTKFHKHLRKYQDFDL